MNSYTTDGRYSLLYIKMLTLLFLMAVVFADYSFATTLQENLQSEQDSTGTSDNGKKTFTFHRMTDGKDILWKAVFEDGKIVELYKNGSKIPKDRIADYDDMIDDELADINSRQFEFPMHRFHPMFNRSALDSSLKQLEKSLSHQDFAWVDSAFNSHEFRSEMDSLRKNLKGLKSLRHCFPGRFDFYFDTSAFNKGMRELRKSLPNMKFHFHNFKHDSSFSMNMKRFGEEMKHNFFSNEEFKSEMRELKKNMKMLDEEMKQMEINMKRFDKEMEKMHSSKKE